MNDATVVYHYWNHTKEPPWKSMDTPLILSIATLRRWEPDVPVLVLDVSEREQDWVDYPTRLGFRVVRRSWCLRELWPTVQHSERAKRCHYFPRFLSAPGDVLAACEQGLVETDRVVVSDADLFYVRTLFPLMGAAERRLCCGRNTGLWHFDQRSGQAVDTLRAWWDQCRLVCEDEAAAEKAVLCGVLHDEACLRVLQNENPDQFGPVSEVENCPWPVWCDTRRDDTRATAKTVHPHGTHFPAAFKGWLCADVRELREACANVLGAERLREIFGSEIRATVSFHDPIGLQKLEARLRVKESRQRWWYHSIEIEPGKVTAGMGFRNVSIVRDVLQHVDVRDCRCLDIGCADGLLSILLARRGATHVTGWDRVRRDNFLELAGRWRNLPLEHACDSTFAQVRGVFDVVVLSGVLYHVLDPLRTLLEARAKVSNGGVLLVETAAIQSPDHRMEFNSGGRFYGRPEAGNYWVPQLGLLDYLLRLCRLVPIQASWFAQNATTGLCRVAIACRAVSRIEGGDAWLNYHQTCGPDTEPGRTFGDAIDWRAIESEASPVSVAGEREIQSLLEFVQQTTPLSEENQKRGSVLMIEDVG